MSDEGEKTCPLCAEEMDLTDQQLRPCKCGYEICVWCWHHIMDMAEKDNTEGRCPACRTPYNKEKIVGTASKCERLVTGMSVEKKQKSQKGKIKTPEGRKQLGSVRVIQRNLVYIVGLPLNLADEDLLQQKEYFGQYGKVLKVSISRTAAGSIQQFANSTCSVYITYSKEEEAVRSIQSAHGFILEGRPLRACFGTTKYCHAWLRNMPCTNADCLYLHEFGPQEDSFTKDEIITAYTRNRVQQITGVTNEMQRRSGNLLPPPTDDYSNSAWPKPISKTTTNNPTNGMKIPLPNSNSGKSIALPPAASWGTRASNSQLSFKAESMKEVVGDTDKNIPDKVPSSSETFSNPVLDEDKEGISHLSCDMSSISINNIQRLEPSEAEQFPETFDSNEAENIAKQSDLVSDFQKKVAISEAEENLVSFNDQRLGGDNTEAIQSLSHMGFYPQHESVLANGGLDPSTSQNGYPSSSLVGTSNGHYGTEGQKGQTSLDLGESSIISNILSMDFDPWDDSLTSPQNLSKFLGESKSLKVLSSRKTQKSSNQSRFSFAREDEEPNLSDFGQGFEYNNNSSNNSIYLDNKINNSIGNGFSSFSFRESEHFATNYFPISENKIPVSRAQVSAPPGFSGPSRAPPPGFTSQMEQTFDSLSGTYISSVRKVHEAVNNGGGVSDLEFMDPAILAVGGRVPSGIETRSNFPAQLNSYESDVRLQVLMQRSFSQQNPRFVDNYSQQTDSYGIPSRMVEQSYKHTGFQQQARSSLMSNNGHWNSWNEVQNSNDIGMGELLRNERLGFNRYYSGHEDSKFQLSTSRDLYNNTTFGI